MRIFLVRPLCAALLLSGLCAGLYACGSDEQDTRRSLLRPVDTRQKAIVEQEKRRLFDVNGELIPSGEKIAGLELPKGLELYRSFENEWYYEARRINLGQLDRYFAARLDPLSIDRNASHVTFENAGLRDNPSSRRISVRIASLIGHQTVADVYIRQAPPIRVYPTESQAEAQIEARRKRAE
ncbi:MAG TPA: hypothetical protein VK509_12225 [Polyangiales bacterium]|nr:hypothetical protein [Polyangiales bacterium]